MRSVGFDPVGLVTASTPTWPFPYRYPKAVLRRYQPSSPGVLVAPIDDPLAATRLGGFSRDHITGSGGIVPDLGWSWQRVVHETQQRQIFDATLDSLRAEAAALGAHGIVDVRVASTRRDSLSYGERTVSEVTAIGTAVRAPSSPPPKRVFTATAGGSQVAQLIRNGFAPSEAAFGIGIVRADLGNTTRRRLRSLGSGDVTQFSEAAQQAIKLAIADIERRAAHAGQIVAGCQPDVTFERTPGASLEVLVTVIGTVLCRFQTDTTQDVLTVMRLDERHQ